jgi:hypothetical protein
MRQDIEAKEHNHEVMANSARSADAQRSEKTNDLTA